MKRTITTFIVLYIFVLTAFSQKLPGNKITPVVSPDPPFKHGEQLKYRLHYGFISGGEATIMTIQELFNNQPIFHSKAQARTTGLVDKIFKVNDIYESYYTMDTNLPLKSVRNISEGSYKRYSEDFFNRTDSTVISKSGVHKEPADILDMVSAFFYFRRIDYSKMKVNDIIAVNTYFDDELFPFYIIFKGREEVETDAGTFKCLRFLPIVEPGRIFKENDDMLFWLTDDANKIPVRVKFDMIVGSFKCDLMSYANVKYPLTSKIKN